MDDVSKLGPLWVSQLTKEVASRRNRAAESLLTVNPDGSYAEQHRILIGAADAMLAAPQLVAALRRLIASNNAYSAVHASDGDDVARMIEWADAFDDASALVAKIEA